VDANRASNRKTILVPVSLGSAMELQCVIFAARKERKKEGPTQTTKADRANNMQLYNLGNQGTVPSGNAPSLSDRATCLLLSALK
jgi:hypothetical protein